MPRQTLPEIEYAAESLQRHGVRAVLRRFGIGGTRHFRSKQPLVTVGGAVTNGKAPGGWRTPRRFAKLYTPGSRASVWIAVASAPLLDGRMLAAIPWRAARLKAAVNAPQTLRA